MSWCANGTDNEWVIDLSDQCPRSPRGERFRDWFARTLADSLVVDRGTEPLRSHARGRGWILQPRFQP